MLEVLLAILHTNNDIKVNSTICITTFALIWVVSLNDQTLPYVILSTMYHLEV